MNFYVLTLFPEMILSGLNHSVIKKAFEKNIINVESIDIRDFANNKHNQVDDYPYGGGAGMVIKPQPVFDAYESVMKKVRKDCRVVYMTPQGKTFNQDIAKEFSEEDDIIILCGHYEGIDERVIDKIVTDEISVGDFILTGGELAAMLIIDSVSRLIPGVLNKEESFMNETFSNSLLEYPQYTRPVEFMGEKVPEILLSGHHGNVDKWRREQSLKRTFLKRPELLESSRLSEKDLEFLRTLGFGGK
ncbi:MAG: tRNA (guanosine(37)-N1)-methyltransferase TrmD [Clostridiales bacterium]|nr:tRNA (guanosine(37)-N1)-methyltransferase TrmD [Clostridiales bacterium]